MRNLTLLTSALVSFAAVAQGTPGTNLVERYNLELASITTLQKDQKFDEALARAQAALPAQAPTFVGTNPGTVQAGLDAGRGYQGLITLNASVQKNMGYWEKSLVIYQQRVDHARGLKVQLEAALTTLDGQWNTVVKEGQDYMAENKPVAETLTKSLAALGQDLKAHNEKQVKLDRKQLEDLTARAAQGNKDEPRLREIEGKIKGYEGALTVQKKFTEWMPKARAQAADMVKTAEAALEATQGQVKSNKDEVATWTAKKNAKLPKNAKKQATAADWVDAIMNDHTNLTKLDGFNQVIFLNRMLVLAPGNKAATKALDNLRAGKDAFQVEKASKGGKPKKG